MELEPGLSGSVALTVGSADSAVAMGSGDVPVLATPRVVALMEAAAVAAIEGALPGGFTSVGSRSEVDHLAPTAIGGEVIADAVVTEVDGRIVHFDVIVAEGDSTVARGSHVRSVVDRERFVARLTGG
jgi:fluoroacetyl-CoA thioesterase